MHSKKVDAGHFSFLEIIKVLTRTVGPSAVKGTLLRTGSSTAAEIPAMEFNGWDDFIQSIETVDNAITRFEGVAKHFGDGLFGLPVCPFASSVETYIKYIGKMPDEFTCVVEELNKPSSYSAKIHVGDGSIVSPFCGVHQTVRSELGTRIKVAGKRVEVVQLGCKSGKGKKGLSQKYCSEIGIPVETVEKILDENMCCYSIRLVD
jgi:hypothetical protein